MDKEEKKLPPIRRTRQVPLTENPSIQRTSPVSVAKPSSPPEYDLPKIGRAQRYSITEKPTPKPEAPFKDRFTDIVTPKPEKKSEKENILPPIPPKIGR